MKGRGNGGIERVNITLRGIKRIRGRMVFPGDKSVSHRVLILGSIASGESIIGNVSSGRDVITTEKILTGIGVNMKSRDGKLIISGVGLEGFEALLRDKTFDLNCENSGTTARLMMGLMAGAGGSAVFMGDESLSRRPMNRVVEPLNRMGAKISSKDGTLPVILKSSKLRGIKYEIPVPSAQVKSALILASLFLNEKSVFIEKFLTRDHTERMLEIMRADIAQNWNNGEKVIEVGPRKELEPVSFDVPGDLSSAIYFIVASLILPDSEFVAEGVLLNPTRAHILEVLKRMGAEIEVEKLGDSPEPSGNVRSKSSSLKGIEIPGEEVPLIIDEIPILAVAGFFAEGVTKISGAGELRFKESDRIKTVVSMLNAFGGEVEEYADGFKIKGPNVPCGCEIDTNGDHRIVMASSIMALATDGEVIIKNADAASISFPGFYQSVEKLTFY